jgi:hypothetical protein
MDIHIYIYKSNYTIAESVTLQTKLDAEKSKHASLAQQNGFGPAFLHSLLRFVKGTAKPKSMPNSSHKMLLYSTFWMTSCRKTL